MAAITSGSQARQAEISVSRVGRRCRELTRRYVERAGGTVESDTPTANVPTAGPDRDRRRGPVMATRLIACRDGGNRG